MGIPHFSLLYFCKLQHDQNYCNYLWCHCFQMSKTTFFKVFRATLVLQEKSSLPFESRWLQQEGTTFILKLLSDWRSAATKAITSGWPANTRQPDGKTQVGEVSQRLPGAHRAWGDVWRNSIKTRLRPSQEPTAHRVVIIYHQRKQWIQSKSAVKQSRNVAQLEVRRLFLCYWVVHPPKACWFLTDTHAMVTLCCWSSALGCLLGN